MSGPPESRLRLVSVDKLGDPRVRASLDVTWYANQLDRVVRQLPPLHHALALDLMSDWRMYCLERNCKRWPDGKYYLLDRGYQLWRAHRIGLTTEELDALAVREWERRAIVTAFGAQFHPLQADCFQHRPRRQLANFAALVGRLEVVVGAWVYPARETTG